MQFLINVFPIIIKTTKSIKQRSIIETQNLKRITILNNILTIIH